MTDIVEQLRLLQSGAAWQCEETAITLEDAADEIERLRADLLKAEMQAEIAGVENITRAVAIGRREGIEAALPLLAASDEVLSGLARGECEQFMYAEFAPVVGAFRALLEDER